MGTKKKFQCKIIKTSTKSCKYHSKCESTQNALDSKPWKSCRNNNLAAEKRVKITGVIAGSVTLFIRLFICILLCIETYANDTSIVETILLWVPSSNVQGRHLSSQPITIPAPWLRGARSCSLWTGCYPVLPGCTIPWSLCNPQASSHHPCIQCQK